MIAYDQVRSARGTTYIISFLWSINISDFRLFKQGCSHWLFEQSQLEKQQVFGYERIISEIFAISIMDLSGEVIENESCNNLWS